MSEFGGARIAPVSLGHARQHIGHPERMLSRAGSVRRQVSRD
jgi:hypothetical protein